MQPYWRALMTLKCAVCGGPTRHALTREQGCRDYCEEEERKRDLSRRDLNARVRRRELAGIDVRWSDGDGWVGRTVIQLHEYRDGSGGSRLIELSEVAHPDQISGALGSRENDRPGRTDVRLAPVRRGR